MKNSVFVSTLAKRSPWAVALRIQNRLSWTQPPLSPPPFFNFLKNKKIRNTFYQYNKSKPVPVFNIRVVTSTD
jgi:hypothetical protein